ncbi:MAG: HU family DNA-binding protein [Bacteroidaceae bacterium]|nr:HU family DNA-binding protein [Bacteroidaceae bacterium]
MSINYRLTPMKDNISKKPREAFYAQVVTKGTIDTHTLCKDIANSCTLTVADMAGAIAALVEKVEQSLLDGYNVYIDGLGTFSISAESPLVEHESEMKSKDIKVKNIHYRAAVPLKKAMKASDFSCVKE